MLPLIMAGMGLLKGRQDKEQQNRDRGLQATTVALSPWTHMSPSQIPIQAAGGGIAEGLGGFIGGQGQMANFAAADQDMAFKNALMSKLGNAASPVPAAAAPASPAMSGMPQMGGFGKYASSNLKKPSLMG